MIQDSRNFNHMRTLILLETIFLRFLLLLIEKAWEKNRHQFHSFFEVDYIAALLSSLAANKRYEAREFITNTFRVFFKHSLGEN